MNDIHKDIQELSKSLTQPLNDILIKHKDKCFDENKQLTPLGKEIVKHYEKVLIDTLNYFIGKGV